METKKRICVIGAGQWGKNHIKTLYELGNLYGIVDTNPARLNELLEIYNISGYTSIDRALEDGFDGYTIATPATLHFETAKKILKIGKPVMVEKPMTLSSESSLELVEIAKTNNTQLMVGHVLLFHPAIRKIKELIENGKIGKLYYLYSTRLNLGTVRTEENVFWSFAPHDISVIDYLVGSLSIEIESKGSKYLQRNIYDYTMTQLTYPDNVNAHIFVSWLHPFKEQRLVVVGSKGMISFDDSSLEKEIKFYEKRITFENGFPEKVEKPTEIIPYEKKQPLTEELKYFVENMYKKIEIADGKSGYEVVRVLEKSQELIEIR